MRRSKEKVTERSIRFPDTLYIQGLSLAQKEGVSFPELIRNLLAKELEKLAS